jgi:hypothetical protein
VPKNCKTCRFAFRDDSVGYFGCALLLEMPGAPELTGEEYMELDLWDSGSGSPCPQWKEDDLGKEMYV